MFILCIDDMPERYVALSQVDGVTVFVTCRIEEVDFYLSNYLLDGICLDHDMPFGDGQQFALKLRERNIPIAITSMNPLGANKIKNILDEYETPNIVSPCAQSNWVSRALNLFRSKQ